MKKSNPWPILVLFLTVLFLNCNQPTEPTSKASATPDERGTAKMIKLLQEAYSKIDPMKSAYFANSLRAEQYRLNMEKSTDLMNKLNNQLQFAYELLNAGKNEQAVGEFEKLLQGVRSAGISPDIIYQINRLLALAYIRVGETNNCVQRYNDQSCLMPLQGKGIYTVQESSRAAIRIYEEMLREKPDDYETIWMLNFVFMTVGEYPLGVPAQWRIPESSFQSDFDFPVFKNIADKIGVNTVGLSGGTCVEDFNNDGLLDIIASSWGAYDQLRFYVNNGDGTFSEKTKEAGLTGLTGGLNVNHADYNNDGFADVLILRGAWFETEGRIPNSLLKNNGDGTFSDVTLEAGLLNYAPTQAAAWGDFNNDGWLDLFIGNESSKAISNLCEFYFNNGDGTFTNRVNETGLGQYFAYIKGCAAGDVNNDGLFDLYISTISGSNKLLLNNGVTATGAVTFTDITDKAGVAEPIVAFPCWMFDFNNDGWQDIFAAGFGVPEGTSTAHLAALNYLGKFAGGNPRLYINNKDNTFTDISQKAGLTEAMFVMGSNYGDLDNDGWLDFYLGTGAPSFTAKVPNKMFRNNNGKTLQDITTVGGFGHNQKGHGVGFGDFDNDGDQDIFCIIGGAFEGDVFGNAFFLNPFGNKKSWVNLKLAGTKANRSAIGTRIKVTTVNSKGKERDIYATVSTGSSFGSNSLQLELGLDDAVKIKAVEVRWHGPEKRVDVYNNVSINTFVEIVEGAKEVEYLRPKRFSFPG